MITLKKIAVLPGDGIGPEIIESCLPIFEHLGIKVDLVFGDVGWEFWKKEGNSVPQRTWKLINESDTTLLGAITSKPHLKALEALDPSLKNLNLNYISPVIQLRQKLKLFANVRPLYNIKNNFNDRNYNMTVIRENTEGLYAGFDFHPLPTNLYNFIKENKNDTSSWNLENEFDGAAAIRLITRTGLKRLFKFAFEWAIKYDYKRVTWADKPNVLRNSGQLALSIFEEIATQYPNVDWEIQNVDATAMWMVKDPGHFGVIVSENQFGDILSDLGAGIMGGLGLAPSANFGYNNSYFEPVHGSAPKYTGMNKVNPSAQFLSIALLLEHFGYKEEGTIIKKSIEKVIGDGQFVTYDLGGNASTTEMAEAIIKSC